MEKINLGIVASEFNYDITYAMVELAKEHAKFLDANIGVVLKVPGVFDMPLAVKKLLERDDIDCVVTLGAVIEGQTEHDEVVAQHASRKIADLSLEYGKPVALGIAGPGMSRLEAHQRVEYAKRAVEAAVKMCKVLRKTESKSDKDDDPDIDPNVGRFLEMG
ncbi:MAG TPA: 6,7-dimethyl-8-ribityllumazine synthase [Candidatus Altiarchaeales archaeon]|nr:6,7-dimethyl-8-ribityllumazine synthase [Candidatus Altiarchaeales archaeon]